MAKNWLEIYPFPQWKTGWKSVLSRRRKLVWELVLKLVGNLSFPTVEIWFENWLENCCGGKIDTIKTPFGLKRQSPLFQPFKTARS